MRRILFLLAMSVLTSAPVAASPSDDATKAVMTVLDKFNGGDVQAFFAAHKPDATIVDEFAPYIWTGTGSAQRWAGDYTKDAEARGISKGRVDYGKPIQANSDGNSAYIVLPTTYSFDQKGRKMAAKGSMTFIMAKADTDWKIVSWTYSAPTPTPQ